MATKEQATDYLKEDPPITGQNWSVVSFVSPTDKVLEKQLYYLNQFLVKDVNKTIVAQGMQMAKKLSATMRSKIADTLDKLKASVDPEDKHLYQILNAKYGQMQIDEEEFIDECHRQYTQDRDELLDKFKIFLTENRAGLDREFDEAHDHVTSVRGFKIRGSYARYEDARKRCEFVRDSVEPGIHAYVVQTGTWFPVDMDADEVQDQDYMLPALNDLMGKYHEGMANKDKFFNERKREMMEAPSDRKEAAKERLRKKLAEKKKAAMKKEISDFKEAQGN